MKTKIKKLLKLFFKITGIIIILFICYILYGITQIEFVGSPLVELSGDSFDDSTLGSISSVTGIIFPSNSEGLEYYRPPRGIDWAFAAKVKIPNNKNIEFQNQNIFIEGEKEDSNLGVGNKKKWWTPNIISKPIIRHLRNASEVTKITYGKEKKDFIIYINYFTM